MQNYKELASTLLKKTEETMNATEKHVLEHLNSKEPISRNTHNEYTEKLTFGQKVADQVAAFGGSWPFIGLFMLFLLIWVVLNSYLLLHLHRKVFDPYPFILLNLFLSMLAAIQAPVIMMSQNRQAAHDRLDAQHDYEVNLKAELEIMALHQKLDELREKQLLEVIGLLRQQTGMLENLIIDLTAQPGNKPGQGS
jgi:uncharacterized membrane protein